MFRCLGCGLMVDDLLHYDSCLCRVAEWRQRAEQAGRESDGLRAAYRDQRDRAITAEARAEKVEREIAELKQAARVLRRGARAEIARLESKLAEEVDALNKSLEGALADKAVLVAALARAGRELDAAWNATGVAGSVRGMATLDDVVATFKRERNEARERIERQSACVCCEVGLVVETPLCETCAGSYDPSDGCAFHEKDIDAVPRSDAENNRTPSGEE